MARLRGSLERLRKEKIVSRVDVNIGKAGLHEGVAKEIERRLREHGAVKIKLLKSARSIVSSEDIKKLAERLGAILADERGYTYVLISRKQKDRK
uniref:RNA-binding protein n=1 Tax=Ignisphaera aggregans TaxID=334771 RepID=A0A7C4FFV7_9CREN